MFFTRVLLTWLLLSPHQANCVVEAKNFRNCLHQVNIETLIPVKQHMYVYQSKCDNNNINNNINNNNNNNNKS